ncbi:hypothetical protein SUGI_0359590, partial [Cryptomeria japonica]
VQAECKGLPLALKVIGSCLNGELRAAWETAKKKLSKGESISDYQRNGLLRCLETSISFLDDVARECFLDLGLFPADIKICADALLDIWVYFRKMEWQEAFAVLWELASRNLLNLTSNSRSAAAISYGNASELYFSQNDVMRDLAIYLAGQDHIINRKRLFMHGKEQTLPGKWELLNERPFDALIVSIHTGPMDESEWFEMNSPEAEVLMMFFAASEYHIPPFIWLVAPNLQKQSNALHNLEKLSLSLCEGFESVSRFNYTKVQEFNLDHCSDLEELPPIALPGLKELPSSIGNLGWLEYLDISLFEGSKELPDEKGNLLKLREFDMRECPRLKRLPISVCGLSSNMLFAIRRLRCSGCGPKIIFWSLPHV